MKQGKQGSPHLNRSILNLMEITDKSQKKIFFLISAMGISKMIFKFFVISLILKLYLLD